MMFSAMACASGERLNRDTANRLAKKNADRFIKMCIRDRFYLLWKAPREDFWRLCLPLFSGMTIALACYAVLPTALDLRPYWVPGSDVFARVVRFLYRTDTATNVCPSIHVFNSVTLLLAYYRSHIFDAPRRRWMRPAAAVLCISIVCSTVLLKQHSCIDVALGALLALVLDSAFTAAERSQLPQVRRA